MSSEQEENRKRNALGRFERGVSGNPGGRPKEDRTLQEAAKEFTEEALRTVVQLMRSGKPMERLKAAQLILERGWGKPAPPTESVENKATQIRLVLGTTNGILDAKSATGTSFKSDRHQS